MRFGWMLIIRAIDPGRQRRNISMIRRVLISTFVLTMAFLVIAEGADLQTTQKKEKSANADKDEAAIDQERLAVQFREFEAALLRLAQRLERSSKAEDRDRAVTLKAAIKKASEVGIDARFETLIGLLRNSKSIDYAEMRDAMEQSKILANDIRALLDLLTSDNDSARLKSEKERVRKLLEMLEKVIREQKVVRAQTEGKLTEKGSLSREQEKLRKSTLDIAKAMNDKDGKGSSEGKGEKGKSEGKGDGKEKSDGKGGKGDEKQKSDGKGDDGKSKGDEKQKSDGKGDDGKSKGDEKQKSKGILKEKSDGKGEGKEKGQKSDGKGEGKEKSDGKGEGKEGQAKGQGKGQDQQGQQKSGGNQQQPNNNDQQQLPGQKRVQDAAGDQKNARDNIDKSKNDDASKNQDDAIKKLEEVRKQWEALLRQLREEEMRRLLEALQARCQRMLALQMEVFDGTARVEKAIALNSDKKASRAEEQKSLQLSDREQLIVHEAILALQLLETEGSAVAFPEAFSQVRDDATHVSRRLGKADVGPVTQAIEQDIIALLKEMIEALEKAKQDLQNKQQQQQQNQTPPPPDQRNQPLIDRIAELKMIRSMQIRVNGRTTTYGQQYPGEQANDPDIQKELANLAQRQQKIFSITNDIYRGKNK
jgi:hypothetical protein